MGSPSPPGTFNEESKELSPAVVYLFTLQCLGGVGSHDPHLSGRDLRQCGALR